MKRGIWRSVEEWKSALMTLPDNSFFELLRSVFGNIKTPFNKQRLLEDLFNFLSRNEIRKTIAAYIDGEDHKIISAVALLDEPAPGDLESFFSGELSCAELQALLLNLEERLVLYRFRDEKILRLALNPVLEPVLAPFIADSRCLFPFFDDNFPPEKNVLPEREKKRKAAAPEKGVEVSRVRVSDGRIFAALFALLLNEDEPFKAEGKLRKKILDRGKKLLPGLDLELAVKILLKLELLQYDESKLVSRAEKVDDYGELASSEREEYWAAGAYLCLEEQGGDIASNGSREGNAVPGREFLFSRSRLRETVFFIRRFMNFAGQDTAKGNSGETRQFSGKKYPEITLRRFFELLRKESDGTDYVWGSPLFERRARLSFEPFLAAMEMTGLLEKTGGYWKAPERPAGQERKSSQKNAPASEPVIVTNTAFSFIPLPEISFSDALALGAFCSLKENSGAAVCFELTRASAVQGFDRGMTSARMLELLGRLSGNRLDANLGWTLKEWESRYAGVSLHQGIILVLAEDRRYLAEAGPVASLIRRTLSPGVYLLSPEDKSEAAKALRKAGVDIIAQPPFEPGGKTGGRQGIPRNSFPRIGGSAAGARSSLFSARPPGGEPGEKPASVPGEADSAELIKQKFRGVLERMRLGNPEREELSARIERRLVLSEAQLEKASLRYEKLEARGLDYVGKAMIAKQAIEAGSLLEISWPGSGGVINKLAGFPEALEKKEGESILVLRPVARAEEEAGEPGNMRVPGDTVRVPLGKISLLRRIKQSIFGD